MNKASPRAETTPTTDTEEIARRAYELYCARGCEHGRDVEDWLIAESQLLEESGQTVRPASGTEPTEGA